MFETLLGKTVLVTGASAGIGAATATEFVKATNGNIKLILGARRVSKLEELADGLKKLYPSVQIYVGQLDVSEVSKIDQFFAQLPAQYSEIDVLINNSGKALGQEKVGDIDPTDIATVFDTNVLGLIAMTQIVLKGMKKRNRGDIVQLGSIAGRWTYAGGSIYCSSKAALKSFTEAMRKELTSTKIRVIEVAPGNTKTEFALVRFKGDADRASQVYEGVDTLLPQDVAELIVFACSRRETAVIAESIIMSTNQAGPQDLYRKQ
ncbi:NADP-dependent 3-hydroxy acid dehydrogenase [Yamadazyma tenuis]|uniref:NAD(P)-binding protein n=1 Tax=Candida tenuis (strain ATCC 10573 / BCRC 21748 / CBS 615 / JCM 9827 / NBRC 10315 / NRRL Y-1498 / VKM Y-70) TaxID=590646 RepID=G3B0S9_CANTC|nr:NAD(P)-binding protein [Yamadazyma tenuis ATCC 10573]EGV64792.1 NAD(P)-binding protein [Yamadazyma tenuis ATCC 10573]WEJ97588.1 NADP-dependent 3-hydroxy acid dehydrogenase [Yamadazyma tenuis]